jgi:hypothetical protein
VHCAVRVVGDSDHVTEAHQQIQADTVDALMETVRDFLHAEDSRGQSLIGRGSGLAGFAGLIVSLSGLIARDLFDRSSSGTASSVAGVVLVVALIALVGTIAVVVFGLLWPRSYDTIAMEEIERYPLQEFVFERRAMVQGRTMRGLIEALASERSRNAAKAKALKLAYLLLGAGLALVALSASILILSEAFG